MKRRLPLVLYSGLFFLKLGAYFYTGYFVLLAEALHSIVDAVLIFILVISRKITIKPADYSHPFGHERMENIASVIVSVSFITIVSFEIIKESALKIIYHTPPIYGSPGAAYFVLLVSFSLVMFLTYYSRKKEGAFEKTVFVETINDQLATGGAFLGIFFAEMGYTLLDPIFGGVIGVLIAINAFTLLKYNISFLLGKSPSDDFYENVEKTVHAINEVRGVHDIIAEYIGEDSIHIDLHVTLDPSMSIEEADRLTEKISRVLKEGDPRIKYTTVHVCPHFGNRRRLKG
jgi:cation diffusion facilitator family transporter